MDVHNILRNVHCCSNEGIAAVGVGSTCFQLVFPSHRRIGKVRPNLAFFFFIEIPYFAYTLQRGSSNDGWLTNWVSTLTFILEIWSVDSFHTQNRLFLAPDGCNAVANVLKTFVSSQISKFARSFARSWGTWSANPPRFVHIDFRVYVYRVFDHS